MRSHQSPRNGDAASVTVMPSPLGLDLSPRPPFQSTLSLQKLRRLNYLALLLRLASFCFSVASAIFMAADYHGPRSASTWYHLDAYRYVFAANAIVSLYSLFELAVSVWEISMNATLLPEVLQVWFDFGHDQVFAYMLMSAGSAGAALSRTLKSPAPATESDICSSRSSFCIQADIAVALGFASFMFLGFSCLLSGFRVACFIIRGSRFHL
ncbi:hypothetical protein SAY86_003051 [Trapa natans]|uniref:CASP-like protein n=1 Tax=Trapa natans TaxID=22666 RepID=A0AAN7R1J9_TRANT|nr:hypothetical protein SAY86_003051 [Trapa natans]